MIVRAMGEGQFRLPDEATARLNQLDDELEADVAAGIERDLSRHLHAMRDTVMEMGTPLELEEILPSDFILPPASISLEELSSLLSEEGLVPG